MAEYIDIILIDAEGEPAELEIYDQYDEPLSHRLLVLDNDFDEYGNFVYRVRIQHDEIAKL